MPAAGTRGDWQTRKEEPASLLQTRGRRGGDSDRRSVEPPTATLAWPDSDDPPGGGSGIRVEPRRTPHASEVAWPHSRGSAPDSASEAKRQRIGREPGGAGLSAGRDFPRAEWSSPHGRFCNRETSDSIRRRIRRAVASRAGRPREASPGGRCGERHKLVPPAGAREDPSLMPRDSDRPPGRRWAASRNISRRPPPRESAVVAALRGR